MPFLCRSCQFLRSVSRLKEPRTMKATKAIMPVRTNSPGEPVLSFPPNMAILLPFLSPL